MRTVRALPGNAVADSAHEIRLNGSPHRIPRPMTLLELVQSVGCDPQAVAVEVNGAIVRRAHLGATDVAPGDAIEIVRFVQGG